MAMHGSGRVVFPHPYPALQKDYFHRLNLSRSSHKVATLALQPRLSLYHKPKLMSTNFINLHTTEIIGKTTNHRHKPRADEK